MDGKQQELIFKLGMFEQQIRHLQEQLQVVEQSIVDMASLKIGLGELEGSEGKKILAPMGRGIFVDAKMSSEKLLVDVGGGNLVQKNIPEAQKLIEEQINKLEEVKKELENNLESIEKEMEKVMSEGKDKGAQ